MATQSNWSHALDWQPAWCSFKIVLTSVAAIALLDFMLYLLTKAGARPVGWVLFLWVILPMPLAVFGCYELAKAVF